MTRPVESGLLEQLKTILRRDLKLGPTAPIADDMPLIGGDMDLDSLDILLLVSSVEKTFGIKIPNEAVGRTMFQNVSTLARFIGETRDKGAAGTSAAATTAPAETDWLSRLPHGPEFRYVTKVIEVTPGKTARGQWMVDGTEPFFRGHFPGRPIVPGVLLIESMAQLAGLALGGAGGEGGMLVHADVRFDAPVTPPATIDLTATLSRTMGAIHSCDVIATVKGVPVARGTVAVRLE